MNEQDEDKPLENAQPRGSALNDLLAEFTEEFMFKTYQSKPRDVEAVQFTNDTKDQVLNSLTGQHAPDFERDIPIIKITTIHGEVAIVRFGDWIVKDEKLGTYYPVKNDIFHKNYDVTE